MWLGLSVFFRLISGTCYSVLLVVCSRKKLSPLDNRRQCVLVYSTDNIQLVVLVPAGRSIPRLVCVQLMAIFGVRTSCNGYLILDIAHVVQTEGIVEELVVDILVES